MSTLPGSLPVDKATLPLAETLRRKRFDIGQRAFRWMLAASLAIAFAVLALLVIDVVRDGSPVLTSRLWDFLTSPLSRRAPSAGILQGIQGSFLIAAIIAIIAFPLGVGSAVYLEEYARDSRVTRFINVNIRNLAGVPSIVYGILGLALFVQALRGFTGGRSVIAGGLTLAVLVLPIVIITSQEALRAVPSGIREAAYGVGATRWEMVRSHVLPYAAPGILTGTILSLARGLGETAPLILVGATTGFLATGDQNFFEKLQGGFTALPMVIFGWSRERPDFRPLAAAAIVALLVVIFIINAVAILLRNRYERKW
ncbi:MAG TPA: phosphate ABC transporter permease PstA [Acidimicrobiales bacterium]